MTYPMIPGPIECCYSERDRHVKKKDMCVSKRNGAAVQRGIGFCFWGASFGAGGDDSIKGDTSAPGLVLCGEAQGKKKDNYPALHKNKKQWPRVTNQRSSTRTMCTPITSRVRSNQANQLVSNCSFSSLSLTSTLLQGLVFLWLIFFFFLLLVWAGTHRRGQLGRASTTGMSSSRIGLGPLCRAMSLLLCVCVCVCFL